MTTGPATIAPVRRSVTVPVDPQRAFELFTTRMSDFWPREHHIGSAAMAATVLEGRPGGRWYERGVDGSECQWGRVLAWEPPGRLVLAWQISAEWSYDPDLVTEVEVRFVGEAPGVTRVELEHRDLERFGASAEAIRGSLDNPKGWPYILDSFAGIAA